MNPSDTQILFAHCQEHLVSSSNTTSPDVIRKSSRALAELSQLFDVPITFALVPNNNGKTAPIDELSEFATDANTFTRLAASPFLDDVFARQLASNKRKCLIIGGYAAEVVIMRTALDAASAGYTVYIPVDAVGSMSERTERAAFAQIERVGVVLTCAYSIFAMIAPDFDRADGAKAYDIAQALQQ